MSELILLLISLLDTSIRRLLCWRRKLNENTWSVMVVLSCYRPARAVNSLWKLPRDCLFQMRRLLVTWGNFNINRVLLASILPQSGKIAILVTWVKNPHQETCNVLVTRIYILLLVHWLLVPYSEWPSYHSYLKLVICYYSVSLCSVGRHTL